MTLPRRTRALLARTAVAAALLAELALVASGTRAEPGTADAPAPAVADYGSGLWPDRPRVELSFDVAPTSPR